MNKATFKQSLLLGLFAFFLLPRVTQAQIEFCCDSLRKYDPETSKCVSNSVFAPGATDIICSRGYVCEGSNTTNRGLCVLGDDITAMDDCCSGSRLDYNGGYDSNGIPACYHINDRGLVAGSYRCHYQKDENYQVCNQATQKCVDAYEVPQTPGGCDNPGDSCCGDVVLGFSCDNDLIPDSNRSSCFCKDPTKVTLSAKPCRTKNNEAGIETSFGCIPYQPIPFIGWILRWGIGIGGGIAFLLMSFASFQLMTSAGDPEKLKNGKEMFVSAGTGLLFIIFSVFLLQLIGSDILQIPGFK